MKKHVNCNGFTLIEVVVAMAIFGLIFTGVSNLMFAGMQSWAYGENHIDVMQNLRYSLDIMTRELRQADQIDASSDGDYIKFTIDTDTFQYQLDTANHEIQRIKNSDNQPLASQVESISFSYDPSPGSGVSMEYITISLRGLEESGKEIFLQSRIRLMNVK